MYSLTNSESTVSRTIMINLLQIYIYMEAPVGFHSGWDVVVIRRLLFMRDLLKIMLERILRMSYTYKYLSNTGTDLMPICSFYARWHPLDPLVLLAHAHPVYFEQCATLLQFGKSS